MKKTGMNRLVVVAIALACGLAAYAMPTKEELVQAQELVKDLTADDMRALKSGAKKPGEVAAAQVALADEAETEAGKYLLLQGAFRLYARSADYDAAADVLARIRNDIKDFPPEVVVELVNGEMRRVAADKAPGVLAIFRDAQRTIKCRKELAAAAAQAKPSNAAVMRRLAECHAGLGDWAKALEIFAKAGDEAAKYELDPSSAKSYDLLKAANFWWGYPAKDDEPFKMHAAALYKKGLADGSISGLRKTLAEKRVKEMESVMVAATAKVPSNARYCVIDLSAGPTASKYPVKWLATPPVGGFNADEYKTTKLVLRRVEPGTFTMGASKAAGKKATPHEVTLTRPFWLCIYEVTQKQWKNVMGNDPSSVKGDVRPVETVTWNECQEFTRRMTEKLGGEEIRLPTEAEWEFACRAGTTGDFGGTGRLDDMGWYKDNNSSGETHAVGQKQANAWDFYDMHGNVEEWCNDWHADYPHGNVSDPQGPLSGQYKVIRGGERNGYGRDCTSVKRWIHRPDHSKVDLGCRLAMNHVSASTQIPASAKDAPADSNDNTAEQSPAKVVAPAPAPASNGKEISVKLATGVTMDFVPCPAGSFEMGNSGDEQSAKFKHKVTITRPFWIGKYQVTSGQWRVFYDDSSDLNVCDKALGGMAKAKGGIRYVDALGYCNFLMKKFKRYLPKGYVYRLPTEAEWEYALRANCSDENDPYVQVFAGNRDGEVWRKIAVENEDVKKMAQDNGFPEERLPRHVLPTMKVGTKLPNAWGIYDMLGNGVELVLDTVQVDDFKRRWGRNEHVDLYGMFKYKADEVDPLRMVSANVSCPCCIVRRKSKSSLGNPLADKMVNNVRRGGEKYNTFRVVIGPDLLKERGIKLSEFGK